MNTNRIWMIGTGIAIVAVVIVGWFLGISPVVQQSHNARSEQASLALSNGTSEARVAALKKKFANISELEASLDSLTESVPIEANIPVFLREVNDLTASSGVTLGTVSIGDAQSYVPPVTANATSRTDTATASPSPSPSASASASSGETAVVTPVVTGAAARLVQVPVTVSVSGDYSKVMTFLGGVQNGSRLYFVNTVNVVQAGDDSTEFTGTIAGFVYVLPEAK